MYLFLILNVFFLWLFIRIPKKLTPYEIVGIWLVAVIYHDDWLTIVSVNLGLIETTKQTILGLVIGLNRVLLSPLQALFFLEIYMRMNSIFKKAFVFAGWVVMSIFLQYLEHWMGLYHNVRWSIWWSIVIWSVLSVLLIGANRIIKSLLQRAKWE